MQDQIFEQLSDDEKDRLNSAKNYRELEAAFTEIMGLGGSSSEALKPNAYQATDSEYGLKARGVKTREKLNAQAIEIINRVDNPQDLTEEDRNILLQYSGKGGLSDNSQYEYYTPTFVAEGVWNALKKNGFASGSVLEPSCGAGVFLGTKPEGAVCFGNDLDPVGSKVSKLLNPESIVSNTPFEAVVVSAEDESFDCAVGNVPFGSARGASANLDPAYKNEKQIERYFLLRMLDKIKPNGLICVVVPTNIIGKRDAGWQRFRIELSKKAEFLGAHKLAGGNGRKDEDVFGGKGGQGTSTTTDVIVLRKHPRSVLDKIHDIASDTLWATNVYFDEFIEGRYWQGEGKPFIQGEYSLKKRRNGFDEVVSGGAVEPAAVKAKLAHKFHSRIDWDELDAAEPREVCAVEGDRRYLGGVSFEYTNGLWQKVVVSQETITPISEEQYGFATEQDLAFALQNNATLLSLSYEQAQALLADYPSQLSELQKEAIKYGLNKPEALREQLMRGILFGGMLSRMKSAEDQGEDVSMERQVLQEQIVAEIDTYGHPLNNSRLRNAASDSGLFKMYQNAVDRKGQFSALLSGQLERAVDRIGYDAGDPTDVVTHMFVRQGKHNIFFDDFKEMYVGERKIESLGDLANVDGLAITPSGTLMPMNRYCSGDIFSKIAELAEAMDHEGDQRLVACWKRQIDEMLSKMKKVETEDIVFGVQQNWFDRKYIDDFIRSEGFEIGYGKELEVEKEHYDGTTYTATEFDYDYTGLDGEFVYTGKGKNSKNKFENQLIKVLNGGKIDRLVPPQGMSDTEKKAWKETKLIEYHGELNALEERFNSWMQQHKDIQSITDSYNRKFNGYVPVQYETDPLVGMDEYFAEDVKLHGYQNAEVRRLSEEGRGICGFGVGLGKTFTGLATCAHDHKMGRSKKKCIVVPKSVLENWYHEARALYRQDFFYNKIKFIGLEVVRDKGGNITQVPLMDERGEQVISKTGNPVFQDKLKAKGGYAYIADQLWEVVQSNPAIVVMSRDWFAKIPLKQEAKDMYVDDMMALLPTDGDKKSYQQDVARQKKQEQYADEGTNKKDSFPFFEEIGFDSVMVDELHEQFKNSLPAGQKTRGIAYLPAAGTAQKGRDMAMKGHYLRTMNNGRGIVGLSATPVTNSPFEIFNQLSLVAGVDDFQRFGVSNVDDFVRIFGNTELMDVMNIKGDVQLKNALSGFKNLDGLRSTFNKFVNLQTADDVGKEVHVPTPVESVHDVEMTSEQEELYSSLKRRANILLNAESMLDAAKMQGVEELEKVQAEIKALEGDSVFSIIRDMDRVATDVDLYRRTMTFILPKKHKEATLKLVDGLPDTYKAPVLDEETNKHMVDPETGKKMYRNAELEYSILDDEDTFRLILPDLYEDLVLKAMPKFDIAESDTTHPLTPKYAAMVANAKKHHEAKGKQLLFTEEKTQHRKLKRLLVHNIGLTSKQIAIINADEAAGEKLDTISKNYNSGTHIFAIANKKAEVGVNLQKGTTAIHHMTYPWTPASINQRNGRGVRQGNSQSSVDVYYYSGKGTFDNYRRMTLLSKSTWMEDLFSGKETSLENADASSREEMIIMVAENPDEMRKKIEQQRLDREKERAKKERVQLTNRFQTYANNARALASNETRKEEAREQRQRVVDSLKEKLNSQKQLGKIDAAEKTQIKLDKAEEKLARVDAEFAAEKARLERTVAQHKGYLSSKAKEGKLPFSASLVDHPENAIADTRGRLYIVGEYFERMLKGSSLGIFQVVEIEQDTRRVIIDVISGRPFGFEKVIPIVDFKGVIKKCTISQSELNIARLTNQGCEYADLPKFIPKDEYLKLQATFKKPHGYYFTNEAEKGLTLVSHSTFIPAYPEPQNKNFREAAFNAYVERNRTQGRYTAVTEMMESLFGAGWEEEAKQYETNLSEGKVIKLLNQHFEDKKEELGLTTDKELLHQLYRFLYSAKAELKKLADNHRELEAWVDIFYEAKKAKLNTAINEEKLALKRQEEEKALEQEEVARETGTFYSLSSADIDRFKEIGITLKVNQNNFVTKWKRWTNEYDAFSRIFISGYATRAAFAGNADAKAIFDAKFTKDWPEASGAWWHVKSDCDVNELFQLFNEAS
jgi:N12 class adenine-specific DNA methylase